MNFDPRGIKIPVAVANRAAPQWDHFWEAGLTRYDVLS